MATQATSPASHPNRLKFSDPKALKIGIIYMFHRTEFVAGRIFVSIILNSLKSFRNRPLIPIFTFLQENSTSSSPFDLLLHSNC